VFHNSLLAHCNAADAALSTCMFLFHIVTVVKTPVGVTVVSLLLLLLLFDGALNNL